MTCRTDLVYRSFAIGYIYSFLAGGVFYWLFNLIFPHHESLRDYPETGEELLAEQDAKSVEKMRTQQAGRKPNIFKRALRI